jgi:ABC-2 type transport system ATP-binding protein
MKVLKAKFSCLIMSEAITIENLSKYYNDFLALDNLSLRIKEDDDVGLLGPNGAGKSTTVKILCGMLFPSSGTAYLDGFDVVKEREQALSRIGAIVETPEFYPYLNPMEVLSYLGRLRGMDGRELESRTKEVIQQVGLEKWVGVKIGKFSRGMKQRLAIAQALLHDPPILILDEPALGLDPRGMVEVREILKRARHKRTIFYASHILAEVTQVCDRVALIDHGRLLVYDSIEKLRKRVIGRPRIEVEMLKPPTTRQIKKIEKLKNVTEVKRKGGRIVIGFKGDRAASAALLDEIRKLGHEVISFQFLEPTLEDVYLKLVGKEAI